MAQKVMEGSPAQIRHADKEALATTVFGQSFLSMSVDEAHEARTGAAAWRGLELLTHVSMVKILATATPYIEGPLVRFHLLLIHWSESGFQDVLNLARLIRPPGLTLHEDTRLNRHIKIIRQLKTKLLPKRAEKLLVFMEAATTDTNDILDANSTNDVEDKQLTKALDTIVVRLQNVTASHFIRRTGESQDHDGKQISVELPAMTVIHATFVLTDEETKQALILEKEANNAKDPNTAHIERVRANMAGVRPSRR